MTIKNPVTTLKNHYDQNSDTIKLVAGATAALTAVVGVTAIYTLSRANKSKLNFIEAEGMLPDYMDYLELLVK